MCILSYGSYFLPVGKSLTETSGARCWRPPTWNFTFVEILQAFRHILRQNMKIIQLQRPQTFTLFHSMLAFAKCYTTTQTSNCSTRSPWTKSKSDRSVYKVAKVSIFGFLWLKRAKRWEIWTINSPCSSGRYFLQCTSCVYVHSPRLTLVSCRNVHRGEREGLSYIQYMASHHLSPSLLTFFIST